MKGSDKAIVLGVVMALVLGVFYLKVLSPKREKASSLGEEITKLEAQIDEQRQTAQYGEQARQEFPTYYGRLVVLGKAVPGQADTASLMVQLSAIARRTDVQFRGIALGAGTGDATSAAATSTPPSPPGSTTSATTTSTTSTTPAPTGTSGSAATPTSSTATPTPATEAGAASLPIGAVVGSAGLPTLPYDLTFTGTYFHVADFLKGVDDLVDTHGNTQVAADGRLLTINGFSLSTPLDSSPTPKLKVTLSMTSYVTPADQGLTAGASPSGPGAFPTQPQTQPASGTVTP